MKYILSLILFLLPMVLIPVAAAQDNDTFTIARVQYRGGGDWYSSPTSLPNLVRFANEQIPLSLAARNDNVQLGSREIFNYPMLYMTGHGNIAVNDTEKANLRRYLENGGFLYVDDDYGFDQYVRPVLQDLFPDEPFFELPGDHPIYRNVFHFPDGRPPKVHEHDNQPPQAFAVYHQGRMVLLYTYESNPADGWAYDEHDNPEHLTQRALEFGVNLLVYVMNQP
ncbi:MAG: DUF4159 domain-containing protein [Balneolaceae bacterium]